MQTPGTEGLLAVEDQERVREGHRVQVHLPEPLPHGERPEDASVPGLGAVQLLCDLADVGGGQLPPAAGGRAAGAGQPPHVEALLAAGPRLVPLVLQPQHVVLVAEEAIVDLLPPPAPERCPDHSVADIGEPCEDGGAERDPVGRPVLVEGGHGAVLHVTVLYPVLYNTVL